MTIGNWFKLTQFPSLVIESWPELWPALTSFRRSPVIARRPGAGRREEDDKIAPVKDSANPPNNGFMPMRMTLDLANGSTRFQRVWLPAGPPVPEYELHPQGDLIVTTEH
jgi:hypothetical protein